MSTEVYSFEREIIHNLDAIKEDEMKFMFI
jgi:hypothetical protein